MLPFVKYNYTIALDIKCLNYTYLCKEFTEI